MIVVLGGGLAGLSTALHLRRYAPRAAVVVVERESEPGGLARSRRVGPFTFDYTGHYLHLRDQETIALVETLLGDRLTAVERRAKIFARGALLDFPFQANLHGLPAGSSPAACSTSSPPRAPRRPWPDGRTAWRTTSSACSCLPARTGSCCGAVPRAGRRRARRRPRS